ncbi:hypothetical protein [Aliicoccus persicus]|uniref:Cytochrome C and Quinol oxidase polypeptide I n=1 Tax=Aliicoccus persicus TaxID=930138 RepID=A0A662Z4R0_9STAP|nr:hypothetical protein [Aliicoccus persicus]SEW12089.1 Cytochrome C and Quinol oxidase polypeptide I [Aliicoccus persicus]
MRLYTQITLVLLFLTAISGVWMRWFSLSPSSAIPYDNVLHAHSHVALIGWLFTAVFLIFFFIYRDKLKDKLQPKLIFISLISVSLLMFVAFLYQGYALFSIITSTVHIFVEYWAVIYIWLFIRKENIPKVAKLFIVGGILANIISSIGPYTLAFLSANKLTDLSLFDMSIYFYLHFQYNGWLMLSLFGLFLVLLNKRSIKMNEKLATQAFWIYFVALFPGFLISALWVGLGPVVETIVALASIAQWISIIMLIIALIPAIQRVSKLVTKLTSNLLIFAILLLVMKSTMELGLIYPPLADLVNNTRDVIIGYLHLTLLGFLTIFVFVLFHMLVLFKENKFSMYGFMVFVIGFLLNELLLFLRSLGLWTDWFGIPLYAELLFVAAILLLIGVTMILFSVKQHKETRKLL